MRQVVRCRGILPCLSPRVNFHEGSHAIARYSCCSRVAVLHRNVASQRDGTTLRLPASVVVVHRFGYNSLNALVLPCRIPIAGAIPVRTFSTRGNNNTQQGISFEAELHPSSSVNDAANKASEVIADLKYKLRHRKVNIEKLSPIVDLLLDNGFKMEHITVAMTTNPQVMSESRDAWQRTIRDLAEYGFNVVQMLPVVLGCPNVLKGKMDVLSTVLDTLYSLYVPSDKAVELVALSPGILHLKPKEISNRFGQLLDIFNKADVINLLLKNPCLLVDEWSCITERFNYVYFRLGFEQQVVRNCRVLSRSIEHITLRHQFLERSGLFEKPDKHGLTTVENPSVKAIFDSTDNDFAVNVAGMTVAEYRAFRDILKQDMEEDEQHESEDESDSDDER